jgi:uncharacterized protein YdeI (YjbR/CyaY-like superfamily)
MKMSKTLHAVNRQQWRAWLEENHATEREIWLVYYKKHTGRPRMAYGEAVEEALCFGWIDSNIQKIDAEKYARKFTPRTKDSRWSALNRRRAASLIREGRMTPAGLAVLSDSRPAKQAAKDPVLPPSLELRLKRNPKAWENFRMLAPSYRRNYIGWITAAKTEETRTRRVEESIALLAENKKLGMK